MTTNELLREIKSFFCNVFRVAFLEAFIVVSVIIALKLAKMWGII